MKELEKELKKGNGIEKQLQNLTTEIQRLRQENKEIKQRLENIEEEVTDAEIYTEQDNYLQSKPESIVKKFKNKITSNAKKGVDVSYISSTFGIKPRQAYNVKDRIVSEEDELAEIPRAGEKNRIVNKKAYLMKLIKDDYPDLPESVFDETGIPVSQHSWDKLFEAYASNAKGVKTKEDKVENLEDWFDYSCNAL